MKIALGLLIGLAAVALIKGFFDMHSAVQAGEGLVGVLLGAAPMILLGAFAILCLGKSLSQISHTDDAGPADDESIKK